MNLSKIELRILDFLQKSPEKAYSSQELAQALNYQGTKNYKKLIKALAFLERINQLQLTKQGHFKLVNNKSTVEGLYRANDKGYGFISYDEQESDLFVPKGKNGGAMDGDRVIARILRTVDPTTGKGSEAEIIEILERKANQVVGEFFAYDQDQRKRTGYLGYVKPQGAFNEHVQVFIDDQGIRPIDHMICIVKISEYPSPNQPNRMVGLVAKEIGHRDEPGVDILSILFQFNIPHVFPESVLEEAAAVSQDIDQKDLKGREDLRSELIMTIDGADAKDLDDAISLTKMSNGHYLLGVHIADVSHYVRENSPLDREAYERGTSVYLTDRVVPMLPQRLSNGICSLHPHEDRLCLSCQMEIDQKGHVVKHRLFKSVINSSYRMTYDAVNQILTGDTHLRTQYEEIVPMLEEMADLHHILVKMRQERGALDFDAPEAQVIVDESGHPLDIELRQRQTGERLIESFMLAANETVARHYLSKQFPFIYRIHEQPDASKMDRFAEFLTTFGLVLRGDTAKIRPKALQTALNKIKDQPYEQAVSTMMLRSMQQAKYSEQPLGHYGLAAEDYTHFTSPIRRYPDLIVHRLVSNYLDHQPSQKERDRWEDKLPGIAIHSSQMERRAVEAERETDALKKAEFMVDKVGETYWGTVSSVTSFGIFVALENTVEGLVKLTSLTDDYYQYNPQHLLLIGERTHKIYRIGQKVQVEVASVSVEDREIDFILLDAQPVEGLDPTALIKASRKKGKPKGKADASSTSKMTGSKARRSRHSERKGHKNKQNKSFVIKQGRKHKKSSKRHRSS